MILYIQKKTYVESSFLKVSNFLSKKIELSTLNIFNQLMDILEKMAEVKYLIFFFEKSRYFYKKRTTELYINLSLE